MDGFISGKDLMERWQISPYELLHRFVKKGLIAYNEAGREISPTDAVEGRDDHADEAEKILAWRGYDLPGAEAEAQQMIQALGDLYFDENQVSATEKEFFPGRAEKALKHKPVHHTTRAKNRARAVAAKLWADKYKDLSVPEIIQTEEMVEATTKPDGSLYSERIVKDWIKDLNPNPPLKGAPKRTKKT